MSTHLLGKKSPKRRRGFRKAVELEKSDLRQVKKLFGIGG